jgi:hypothetical protein
MYNNIQNINEVYIGKDAVAPLFNQFAIMRKAIKDSPWTPKVNTNTEVLKFNRLTENFFGFSTFCFTITPDQSVNCSSLTLAGLLTKDELKRIAGNLKANNTGIKFDPKKSKVDGSVICNAGLMFRDVFSDEEIFAVYLHEIGHCFFKAVEDKDTIFNANYAAANTIKKANNLVKDTFRKRIRVTIDQIKKDIDKINPTKKVEQVFNLVNIRLVGEKVKRKFFKEDMNANMGTNMQSYTDEKFADTFATMYGYGIELHTALGKFDKDFFKFYGKTFYSKGNPIANFIKLNILLNNEYSNYINGVAQDEHPSDLVRISVSIQYIRRELSRENLDPKLKLQLVAQLNELQSMIDDYINNSGDDEYMYILKQYYIELYKRYNGDRREATADNNAIFDTLDDRYKGLTK